MLHSQGDGLAQAMRQVPPQYFTEDFTLSRCGSIMARWPELNAYKVADEASAGY